MFFFMLLRPAVSVLSELTSNREILWFEANCDTRRVKWADSNLSSMPISTLDESGVRKFAPCEARWLLLA